MKAAHLKIAVIVAEFNEYLTQKLLDGAVDSLKRFGVKPGNINVFRVPGSFEIPLVVQRILKKKRFDAIISLGVIIKGETRHFAQVSDNCAKGAMTASLESDIPVIHAVISAGNFEQAVARIGGKLGHKGRDAAKSAIEMANVLSGIQSL